MVIPVRDDLRVHGGSMAWEIQRRRVVKGETRWESFKWFSKLGQALEWAGQEQIRLSEGNSLADTIEAFSAVAQRYQAVLESALAKVADRANDAGRRAA